MSVALRQMTTADLDQVVKLEQEVFGAEAWSAQMLLGELAQQPATRYYLVAHDDEQVVGYAGLLGAGDQSDVVTIAVTAARWGSGIGSTLLEALMAEAGRRGCTRSSSRSGPTTPARRTCTAGTASPRSASGAATTSRPAPTPWSCGAS